MLIFLTQDSPEKPGYRCEKRLNRQKTENDDRKDGRRERKKEI